MLVRIAEIEVYPEYLSEYLAYGSEVASVSVRTEPGVLCLYPMQLKEDSTQIRILEIYASQDAYQRHIATDHFLRYKQGTLHMVKALKLSDMRPLDPDSMKRIFNKMHKAVKRFRPILTYRVRLRHKKTHLTARSDVFFVVLPGFEPRQAEPKSDVLPLHHRTNSAFCLRRRFVGSNNAQKRVQKYYNFAFWTNFFSSLLV